MYVYLYIRTQIILLLNPELFAIRKQAIASGGPFFISVGKGHNYSLLNYKSIILGDMYTCF